MQYLSDTTFQNIARNLVFPVISVILIPFIRGCWQHYGYTRPVRKYRFDKVSAGKKAALLADIDTLTKAPVTQNSLVRMKLCYEQLGIYLPVWHSHQLICCLSDNSISSMDVRLRYFLKYPVVGKYPDNAFSVDDKKVRQLYLTVVSFGVFALGALAFAGWTTTSPFLKENQQGLFLIFSLIYLIIMSWMGGFVLNVVMETRLAVQFGRLFDSWLKRDDYPVSDTVPEQ